MSSHGYQLVHDDWWAKNGGCVATAPDGGERPGGWQFAIFALGTVPAAALTIYVSRNK
ncbi:MAG: hypothetical protein WBZ15_20400 [Mycobacterium sp.]|uniref:hypothetical protein n=1 Tax=Mycobacterium sp. TaxID=1785 RepID=UPI003C665656